MPYIYLGIAHYYIQERSSIFAIGDKFEWCKIPEISWEHTYRRTGFIIFITISIEYYFFVIDILFRIGLPLG